jgi:UDP:flavonoid glycosyltransferase YjiC (YdhE family)
MGRDQRDNAVRAERHGAVLRLRPGASPAAIAAAVRRLLDEPAFRANAQRLGARLRADAASDALVGEIEAAVTRGDLFHPPARGDPR